MSEYDGNFNTKGGTVSTGETGGYSRTHETVSTAAQDDLRTEPGTTAENPPQRWKDPHGPIYSGTALGNAVGPMGSCYIL